MLTTLKELKKANENIKKRTQSAIKVVKRNGALKTQTLEKYMRRTIEIAILNVGRLFAENRNIKFFLLVNARRTVKVAECHLLQIDRAWHALTTTIEPEHSAVGFVIGATEALGR